MELFGDLQGLKRIKKEKLRGVNPMALMVPVPSKVLNIVQLLVLGLTLLPC